MLFVTAFVRVEKKEVEGGTWLGLLDSLVARYTRMRKQGVTVCLSATQSYRYK
jgi:hypothetical protein